MPTPMIDDVELRAVQHVRQETDLSFVRQAIAGLDGTLHSRLGRRSHRVVVSGLLTADTAADDLKKLQEKASLGEEVTFTADISTALSIDKMVIESFVAEQRVGLANQYACTIALAESPELPPPAQVSAFGGLGDFGLGDLGFDPGALGDVLSDIAAQADALMEMADAALDALETLGQLAALADLGQLGDLAKPVTDRVGELSNVAGAASSLGDLLGGLLV
jgi:hypothetical protein